MKLQDLRDLERAELRRLRKSAHREHREQRRAARREAMAARWPRWTAWWEARAREIKIAATVVGGAVAIVTGVPVLYRNAGVIWRHTGGVMWALLRARDSGPPELPPPTGAPSTALDFQKTQGRPPDGGQPQ